MKEQTWSSAHCSSLQGKTVAVTGATGGLGREICRGLLTLKAGLILIGRSPEKTQALVRDLKQEYPGCKITCLQADLEDIRSVRQVTETLMDLEPDILVHNAGAYKIPRRTCSTGLDNVFQIDFASPYYMTCQLLPMLARRRGKVVVMGSVAHTYSPTDPGDLDFSTRTHCHLVYGNAKRYLMFGFSRLMARWPQVDFAIAHPGITVTNITAHYPRALYAIIRRPMKVIFPPPRKAARSMIRAISDPCSPGCWIGPGLFGIWGNPREVPLKTCPEAEQKAMETAAESMYQGLCDTLSQY